MNIMKILFVQTGGTIDKDYPKSQGGYAFEIGEPASVSILKKLDPSFDYEIITAFKKDSLELNDEDRQILADMIRERQEKHVIITHGTDTLLESAAVLAKNLDGKTVVLTGAMRPERFQNSDAPINMGCAIATASLAEPDIYIAMHGIVKPWNKMKRDKATGKFY